MSISKTKEHTKTEQNDEYITNAIIKPMNVFDTSTGKYTTEINQKTVKVETFVNNLKTEKPVLIGYIQVSTMEKFLDGTVKAIPIKIRKV
jgi:acetolactate synthase small subunit